MEHWRRSASISIEKNKNETIWRKEEIQKMLYNKQKNNFDGTATSLDFRTIH
jgi:hypothetical protein